MIVGMRLREVLRPPDRPPRLGPRRGLMDPRRSTGSPPWTAFFDRRAAGRSWRSGDGMSLGSRPTAETVACACPDFCERDHENE